MKTMLTVSLHGAVVLVLASFAAACGSEQVPQTASQSPAAGAQQRDACELITADEAAKILGSQVKMTPRSGSAERSTCDYVTDAYESFTLEVISSGAEHHLKSARSGARIAAGQVGSADPSVNDVIGLQRVENLGDEAYFGRRTTSYVRKGDVLLTFQNAGLNEPAREHWEALARAALARL